MKLLAPLVLASLFAAAPDAAADHGLRFPFPVRGAPTLRIGTPRISIELGGGCRPRHEHRWSWRCEREWIAPVYETRVVGHDRHCRPIVQRVLVRAGCFADVRYRVCGCGARVRC